MSSSTPSLNEDVLLRIVQHVSSPSDLLTIGQSSRNLFLYAEPERIYRTIRCHLNNDAVWGHLIANPAAAARVAHLEILRENAGITPLRTEQVPFELLSFSPMDRRTSKPSPAQLQKSEALLIQALHVMVNLERFIWDRWVPVTNVGREDEESPFTEDVWTALRDYTQLQELSAVDLGQEDSIVDNPYPIFNSSIFTLRNLTHVKLKVYYSPAHPAEGTGGSSDIRNRHHPRHPPRVNITRLKDCLLDCPGLQALDLTIIDCFFYWTYEGNPFTDATSIFEHANWPSLQSLILWDFTVNSRVMLSFLLRHPSLLSLKAGLSLDESDLPQAPFEFDCLAPDPGSHLQLFLPNIRSFDVNRTSMRHLITYPWPVQTLGVLSPRDWEAHPPSIVPNIPTLDDDARDLNSDDRPPAEHPALNLSQMPNLHKIILIDLKSLSQLEKLAELTPQLEALHIQQTDIPNLYSHPNPHSLWLPYLSKWPHLKVLHGVTLWDWTPDEGFPCPVSQDILREVVEACPNLRFISEFDGTVEIERCADHVELRSSDMRWA